MSNNMVITSIHRILLQQIQSSFGFAVMKVVYGRIRFL